LIKSAQIVKFPQLPSPSLHLGTGAVTW